MGKQNFRLKNKKQKLNQIGKIHSYSATQIKKMRLMAMLEGALAPVKLKKRRDWGLYYF